MLWNRFPEFKPYYLTKAAEYEKKIPYGTPVYEHGKSLETRRYEPNEPELEAEIIRYTQGHGNEDFFKNIDWKVKLDQTVKDYREKVRKKPNGRYETDSEYKDRITFELTDSKRIIELNLKKKVEGICWPGGGVSEEVSAANEFALTNGGQIRSLYGMKGGIEYEVRTQTETIVDVIGYPTEYGYDDEMLDEDLCH